MTRNAAPHATPDPVIVGVRHRGAGPDAATEIETATLAVLGTEIHVALDDGQIIALDADELATRITELRHAA